MQIMSDEQKRPKKPYKSTRRANGPMLKYLREEANLSQTELHEISGVSHTQISRIETGESISPRKGTLEALSKALNVELEQLVIRERPPGVLLGTNGDGEPRYPGGAKTEQDFEEGLDAEARLRDRRKADQGDNGDSSGGRRV